MLSQLSLKPGEEEIKKKDGGSSGGGIEVVEELKYFEESEKL